MRNYVLGFAFCGDQVLLIEKKHPEWQKGKINGIGGKIEPNEIPQDAMVREFREETGIQWIGWHHRLTLNSHNIQDAWKVFVFKALLPAYLFANYNSMTDERVIVCDVDCLPLACHYNLRWMVPYCLDPNVRKVITVTYEAP